MALLEATRGGIEAAFDTVGAVAVTIQKVGDYDISTGSVLDSGESHSGRAAFYQRMARDLNDSRVITAAVECVFLLDNESTRLDPEDGWEIVRGEEVYNIETLIGHELEGRYVAYEAAVRRKQVNG